MVASAHFNDFVWKPLTSYAKELRDLFSPWSYAGQDVLESETARHAEAARSADLVLFTKPGCGYCASAKMATAQMPSRAIVELGTYEERRTLARVLGLPVITVPVVFVRGRCVGDGEVLHRLLRDEKKDGKLETMLAGPMAADPFAPGTPDTRAWTERLLCKPPGGEPSGYFLNIYGNTVRLVSLMHVFLFAAGLLAPYAVVRTGAAALLVDMCLLVLSSNLSPLALASTAAIWTRRGPVVPAIPYKVVFALYALFLARVATGAARETETRAAAAGALLNSAFLAVLRF